MKQSLKLMMAAGLTSLVFTACHKDIQSTSDQATVNTETLSEDSRYHNDHDDNGRGQVFTLSNAASGNKVLFYTRTNGHLSFQGAFSTGGNGTGSGLGSQGALILSENKQVLLAVNAGSNTISSLRIAGNHLYVVSTVHSGGTTPISITQHDNLVYVLNAGGDGNIAGFSLNNYGKLFPLPYSKRPLSSSASGPAQISFVNDGRALVVTEKATNKIISYTVNYFGVPGSFHSITSANPTPFGFAVGSYGKLVVSEAAGGGNAASTVSSYRVQPNGSINLINGPVSAGQTAACWVVLTDNEKYAYATNTGSNTVSSFKLNQGGHLDLLNAIAGASGTTPIDAALSDHSKYLYVLNAGGVSISAYTIGSDGSLSNVQTVTGLQSGDVGLAAN